MPERGCGSRQPGGVYAVTEGSPLGMPLDYFIVDPPQPTTQDMGVSAVGVTLLPRNYTYHVFDWVGASFYPNVADFVEETRWFLANGLPAVSRRLPKTLDFAKLTPSSRLVLVHSRAIINPSSPKWSNKQGPCIKQLQQHDRNHPAYNKWETCASAWWTDLIEETLTTADGDDPDGRPIRKMPSFSYRAWPTPPFFEAHRLPGIFMAVPITGLHVVRSNEQGYEDTITAARRTSGLIVEEVDE